MSVPPEVLARMREHAHPGVLVFQLALPTSGPYSAKPGQLGAHLVTSTLGFDGVRVESLFEDHPGTGGRKWGGRKWASETVRLALSGPRLQGWMYARCDDESQTDSLFKALSVRPEVRGVYHAPRIVHPLAGGTGGQP